ncbi:TonB-dependent receptor [Paludibaculum fermentans]|uniref:TonB-dependent receptor n=1 Tax=Paludibaculum fermentans TaxID=1473598 RepID=A0A7S7NLI5_PALFE|nr:carboxypeptidase regulatory-like domain-containing protein [Paludibaculum fermentans]QOY85846.1 TonB-dependent receptor [Paludibaculum fermentans]
MKIRIFFLSVVLVLAATSAWAQAVAGLAGVSGSVRDESGSAVPGASVIVSNDSLGIRRTMDTNESGAFSAPSLPPATGYAVSVKKQGFALREVKNFQLQVGATQSFNVTLSVATTATTVEVTSAAPLVSDTNVGVSQVVGQSQIDNLPINGRRVDSFVLLTPAVVNDGTFGLVAFRGIAMGNAFLTDGNDTTNSFYNENAGRTRISTQISQDAVQEFQVLSNGFSAEFGRAMGGVINTVTRSGTNATHGTAYWFFRNRTLNATDRYANGLNAPEWRHQAGASLGGALKKDKLFYFGNFETVKRNFPGQNRIVNNNLTDGTGNFIPASNCKIDPLNGPTAEQCTAATNFIQKQMNVLVPRTVSSVMGFAKLDYRPNDKDSFSISLNAMHWRSPYGIQTQAVLTNGNMLGNNGNSTVETRYGKASWTRIVTPNLVNEVRYGWFKDRLSDPGASDLWPETGGVYITVAGSTVGAAQAYPRTYPSEMRHQLVDNLSWTYGSHSLKFGLDFQTTEDWMNQLYNANGGYSYANLTAFAKDFSGPRSATPNYSTFTQAFGNPIHTLRTSDINAYIQDVWRLNRKLTLSYGLRYEKAFLPQPTMTNATWRQTGSVPSSNLNFAPRFSLAYNLTEKTVVRAGYGIFYARMHGNMLDTLFLGNGLYQTSISINSNQAGAPFFPNILSSSTGLPAGTVGLALAATGLHNPYSQQGNFSIERQLGKDLGLTANYIWSRGIGIFTQRDLNLGAPGPTVTYKIQDAAKNVVGEFRTVTYLSANKVDKNYGKILQVENGGQSWYNALALQLQKRMSHGLTAQVSYTWSHAIDNANQQGASNNISSSFVNSTYPGDYAGDKGTSSLDQRHRVVINWLWAPTFAKNSSAFNRFLVNGWELSSITTMASSQPTTGTVTFSGSTSSQFSGVVLAYTTLNGSGGWNRVPFLPTGNIDIDRVFRVDARIVRSLPFSERVKANLMFEAFNAFNTQYNTAVNVASYTATGGVLSPIANVGTGTQSQGFPDGTNARRMQVAFRLNF